MTFSQKPQNRWRRFILLLSNPDFLHGDFQMLIRVWRSIEFLKQISALRENHTKEDAVWGFPQYKISQICSSEACLGKVELEKFNSRLKYAKDAERIWEPLNCCSFLEKVYLMLHEIVLEISINGLRENINIETRGARNLNSTLFNVVVKGVDAYLTGVFPLK